MQPDQIDILKISRGSITAPAGCGKTQLIVSALALHLQPKPILILTHTNAGAAALRHRLKKKKIPSSRYKLSTIDGLVLQLVTSFPKRAAINIENIKLLNPKDDYPAIRNGAYNLLSAHHIDEIITSSYSMLIVDEYQDCSSVQHLIIIQLSNLLPTCVLGDPLQAIFGFTGKVVDWENEVQVQFPPCGELKIPWRWKNAGCEDLGKWLLDIRKELIEKNSINFSSAPKEVIFVKLDDTNDHEKILAAANLRVADPNDSVLIIGDSMNAKSRHRIASLTYGAVTVEPVDFKDLIIFSENYKEDQPFYQILELMKEIMTGISSLNLENRIPTLQSNRERNPATEFESQIVEFIKDPNYTKALNLIRNFSSQKNIRVYRPSIYNACIKGFQIVADSPQISLKDAIIRIREKDRALGRATPKRAVGSTLLLKGLEAEYAVVLNADSQDSKNLYVAMTRGSKGLVICSSKYSR
jgi:superfamily I DNA/RNA helicase